MATVNLDLSEYNALLDKVKTLEDKLVSSEVIHAKEISSLKQQLESNQICYEESNINEVKQLLSAEIRRIECISSAYIPVGLPMDWVHKIVNIRALAKKINEYVNNITTEKKIVGLSDVQDELCLLLSLKYEKQYREKNNILEEKIEEVDKQRIILENKLSTYKSDIDAIYASKQKDLEEKLAEVMILRNSYKDEIDAVNNIERDKLDKERKELKIQHDSYKEYIETANADKINQLSEQVSVLTADISERDYELMSLRKNVDTQSQSIEIMERDIRNYKKRIELLTAMETSVNDMTKKQDKHNTDRIQMSERLKTNIKITYNGKVY